MVAAQTAPMPGIERRIFIECASVSQELIKRSSSALISAICLSTWARRALLWRPVLHLKLEPKVSVEFVGDRAGKTKLLWIVAPIDLVHRINIHLKVITRLVLDKGP